MKLGRLTEHAEVLARRGPPDPEIEGIACDSRRIRPGWLFVAVPGLRADGADFIAHALSQGAVAVVSENDLDLGSKVAHVQVPQARRALAEIANTFHGDLSRTMTVVGITGTNGKTTTAFMVRDLLRDGGFRPGLLGTVAYEIGDHSIPASRTTPEAPDLHAMLGQMKKVGCDAVVMEVSSHAIELQRVHGIDFDTCVFTNLTQDHLDFHGDMESYFGVKARLFREMEERPGRTAAVNIDDPWGQRLAEEPFLAGRLLTYGFGAAAKVRACAATVGADGSRFKVETPWGGARIRLHLLGRYNIHNALAALAAGGLCGIDPKRMAKTLGSIRAIPGRLEPVPNRRRKTVFVDYAHTDDALRNVLGTLREICRGRLVVVFGCGGNRDTGKRAKMGRVAGELADYSIVTSDNPRGEDPGAIAAGILAGFGGAAGREVVLDRRAAIAKGLSLVGRQDILLVAGKGHETYQELRDTIVPFDDRETARELLG